MLRNVQECVNVPKYRSAAFCRECWNDAGFYLAGLRPSYYTRAALPGRF
jgi:hypothetical protein